MKRAQGLPVNLIILILIGLIILAVLVAVVVQKVQSSGKSLKEIEEAECKPPLGNPMPIGSPDCEIIYGNFKNLGIDEVCCRIKNNEK
jgi:hypothetical protein